MHNIFLKMTDILNWLPKSPPFSLDKRTMPGDLKVEMYMRPKTSHTTATNPFLFLSRWTTVNL